MLGEGVLGRRHRVARPGGVATRRCRIARRDGAGVTTTARVAGGRRVRRVRVGRVVAGDGGHPVAGVGAHRTVP